ncbi:hypothetical protein GCM10011316_00520 [Roseibium aquae]|uniref:YpeB-like protein with protease inhibitory function n=1 Tax=Roseibium aquae TaxID=1323746 RepID=A0A916T6Y9_9HYPH|nr:hypothetical protein GCM10011316_00520 [Roseibium aquae]
MITFHSSKARRALALIALLASVAALPLPAASASPQASISNSGGVAAGFRSVEHPGRAGEFRHGPDERWLHRKLGPRQIRQSLRQRGFYQIRFLKERPHVYVVRAIGWRGHPVRLVVDARTGEILRGRPIRNGYNWGYGWSQGW